jgi:hypothetical protein
MSWTRVGISVTAAAAVLSMGLTASAIWVLLTNPVTVAVALDRGTAAPVARELAAALINLLRDLLAYL